MKCTPCARKTNNLLTAPVKVKQLQKISTRDVLKFKVNIKFTYQKLKYSQAIFDKSVNSWVLLAKDTALPSFHCRISVIDVNYSYCI